MLDRRSRTLNIALEHARRAVELDAKGDSSLEAIEIYDQSTSLLMCVIESLRSEEREGAAGAQVSNGNGPNFSSAGPGRKEELEKLIAIHDSYRNRMSVLCEICGIPMPEATRTRL